MSVGGWWDNSPPYPYWSVIPPWQGNPYYWGDYFPHRCGTCPCCGAVLSRPMTYTSDNTAG